MKLDSRIIEGKKPLTCFNTEKAKQVNPEFMADLFINQIEHLVCGEDNLMGGYEFERYANEVIEHMKRKVKEIAE